MRTFSCLRAFEEKERERERERKRGLIAGPLFLNMAAESFAEENLIVLLMGWNEPLLCRPSIYSENKYQKLIDSRDLFGSIVFFLFVCFRCEFWEISLTLRSSWVYPFFFFLFWECSSIDLLLVITRTTRIYIWGSLRFSFFKLT